MLHPFSFTFIHLPYQYNLNKKMTPHYKTLVTVITIILLSFHSVAQITQPFTQAYEELVKQRTLYNYPTSQWDSLRCSWYGECLALQPQPEIIHSTCPLAKRMFGWHMIGVSPSSYVWQSISDLSYFSYDVSPSTGNAINSTQIANWATDATVVAAHNNGVNVNLCVTLFNNSNEFSTFFGSASAQTTCRNNLVNAVIAANAKGINIDFEGSGLGSTYLNQFTSFMSSLSTQLHNAVPNSELSIDLIGSYSSSSTLINQLNPFVDLFVIMGYDYYWGGQTSPGPVAPLYNFYSSSYGNVSNDLNNFLKIVTPSKVILGMPYYGRRWGVTNGCTLPGVGTGSSSISTQTYAQFKQNSNGYYSNPQHDTYTFNAYNCFTDVNSIPNQQFIDDVYSFQKKYNVIKERGIAGAAVWRLGYDAGYSDLWNLVNDNLSNCAFIACYDTIFDMGGPQGNYHNTEDYTFTIAPPGATSIMLSFLSFDLENGYDYLKIYDGPTTGSVPIGNLTGSSLPTTLITTTGEMTIQFHSDGATTKSGYKAIYSCSTGNPCTDNYEPNDNTATSYNLFPTALGASPQNTTINSFIYSGSDQDWYKINNFGVNGTLVITASNLPANYDVELYDNGGLCGGCYIAGSYNSGATTENISVNFTTGSAHQPPFFLKIYPNNNSQFSQCNAYTLNVSWTPTSTCSTPASPAANFGDPTCPGPALYSNSNFSMYWTSSGAVYYDYIISEYPYGGSNIVASQNCISGTITTATSPNILAGKLYNWQVRATTDCNTCNSAYSAPSYFHIAPIVSPSGNVTVCNGGGTTLSTPAISLPSPGIVSYQWYFAGNPIGGANSNTYYATQSGNYYVKLIYSGSIICTGTMTTAQSLNVYVNISSVPNAPTLSSNSPVCEGTTLSFSASAPSNSLYFWTGPNGFSSNNNNIYIQTVTTANAGTYYCYVINGGCQSPTSTINATVNPAPLASFTFNPVGNTITFTNTSTNATSYNWDFGDSQNSPLTNPTHTYSSNNNFNVCLTANSSGCNSASNCQLVSLGGGTSGSTLTTFAKLFNDTVSVHKYWITYDIIQSTVDSGYICVGWYQNIVTFNNIIQYYKLDKNGNLVWVRELPEYSGANILKIIKSQNGYLLSFNYNLSTVMEIDEQGNKLWGKSFSSPFEKFTKINSGGYLSASGNCNSCNGFNLIKIDNTGNSVWQNQFAFSLYANTTLNIVSLTEDGFGNFYICAYIGDGSAFPTVWSYDGVLIKVDANGNLLWTKYIPIPDSQGIISSLVFDNNSDIIFGSRSIDHLTNAITGWVTKIDSSGTVISSSELLGASISVINSNSGNVDCVMHGSATANHPNIVALNSSLNLINQKTYLFPSVYSIKPTFDNKFIAVCGQYLLNSGGTDYRYNIFKVSYTDNSCVDTIATTISLTSSTPNWNILSNTASTPSLSLSNFAINPTVATLVDTNICHQCNLTANITPSGSITFCSGGSVTLTADAGMISYLWSNGQTTQSISVSSTGNYFVSEIDNFSCSATSQVVSVTVNPLPISNAGTDESICSGSSVSIGSISTGGYSYSWTPTNNLSNPLISNPNANPTSQTTYILTTTNSFSCTENDTVVVSVNSLPIVNAGSNVTITQGNPTTIGGSPTASGNSPFTYSWHPPVDLNSSIISNPSANPPTTAIYFVTVADANGCSALDSITVTVNPVGCSYSLSDSSHNYSHSGGVYILSVSASNQGCTWVISNSTAWFTVSPTTLQTGNASVTITADSCSGGVPRTGTFTVAGITYTVTQDCNTGTACNPPTVNFAASQTTGNCPFTVDFFDLSLTTGPTSWLWTIYNGGGQPISSNLQNPTGILYNVAGSFLVKLEVADSCGTNSAIVPNYIVVSCPVGIDAAISRNKFVIYPNPTNDQLTFEANGISNDDYTISLKNALGQILSKDAIQARNGTIKMQIKMVDLPSGIYVLTINSEKLSMNFKVQKF
jgi:spore germination protein YaaH/PKD repeat protein